MATKPPAVAATELLKVEIPADVKRRLKAFAATVGRPMNQVIVNAIKAYCK